MTQNILEIQISQSVESSEETFNAGNMYEHNATALQFLLDAAFLQSDYRFYAEFVTVKGVARTEYLTPDNAGSILVSLPQEITAQMTAMCVFNIVQIGDSGKTEQLIKAKKVRLYFSNLENTEKLLDADYAFSVNALLEAIYNNTFKGDKGDQGDSYVLTQSDRTEIAEKLGEKMYGLPLYRMRRGVGAFTLPDAGASASVQSVCIQPAAPGGALTESRVTVGENLLAPILDAKKYNLFLPTTGFYAHIPLYLKPNTAYVISRKDDSVTTRCTSFIVLGTEKIHFCHTGAQIYNQMEVTFSTDETGLVYLETTGVSLSEAKYAAILENEWEGLTLTEEQNSAILRKTFEEPLLSVSDAYTDSFDFLSGELTRRAFSVTLSESLISEDVPLTLTNGVTTVYRYCILLPDEAVKAMGITDGFCASYEAMPDFVTKDSEYAEFVQSSGRTEGIFFGSADNVLYVYSVLEQDAFCDLLRDREAAGDPILVYCCRAQPVVTVEEPQSLPDLESLCRVQVSPASACAEFAYAADLSAAVNDLESRIEHLENNI